MLQVHILEEFYSALLKRSQKGNVQLPELNKKSSRCCPINFTLNLVHNLEVSNEIALGGLLIAKKAVDNNLKISKKIMHRLIVVCIFIAEKCYEEDQNTTETYSLLSGVAIKDIHLIQNKLLTLLDYRLLPNSAQIEYILRGDIEALLADKISHIVPQFDDFGASSATNDFQ